MMLPWAQNGSNLPSKRAEDRSSPIFTYCYVFAILGYLLLVGLGQIYFQRKTQAIKRQELVLQKKLETVRKERENLMLKRERYLQARYILPRARQLGLQPPHPNQVHILPAPVYRQVKEKLAQIRYETENLER